MRNPWRWAVGTQFSLFAAVSILMIPVEAHDATPTEDDVARPNKRVRFLLSVQRLVQLEHPEFLGGVSSTTSSVR